MFNYICLGTNDPVRAARFYDSVLGALGHRRCNVSPDDPEWHNWNGWGTRASVRTASDRGGQIASAVSSIRR